MTDGGDDDDDDDDEFGWSVIKVIHQRTELIFMELTELKRTAVNEAKMKILAFVQCET